MDPLACPAILVAGPCAVRWGKSVRDAAHHAVIVEEIAAMARQTLTINPDAQPILAGAARQASFSEAWAGGDLRAEVRMKAWFAYGA